MFTFGAINHSALDVDGQAASGLAGCGVERDGEGRQKEGGRHETSASGARSPMEGRSHSAVRIVHEPRSDATRRCAARAGANEPTIIAFTNEYLILVGVPRPPSLPPVAVPPNLRASAESVGRSVGRWLSGYE